jgi:hypothetical protein
MRRVEKAPPWLARARPHILPFVNPSQRKSKSGIAMHVSLHPKHSPATRLPELKLGIGIFIGHSPGTNKDSTG